MKEEKLIGEPAVVLMKHELDHILRETARHAAREVINEFRDELNLDPNEAVVKRLRGYLTDRGSVEKPREEWANGWHIRRLVLRSNGKPRSQSWFQKFKQESGLGDCISRKSICAGESGSGVLKILRMLGSGLSFRSTKNGLYGGGTVAVTPCSRYVPVMKWKNRNLRALADIICGNVDHFEYRSSSYITEFFEDCDLDFIHDGSTRWAWVADRIEDVLAMPHSGPSIPPDAFVRIIRRVMEKDEAQEGDEGRVQALAALNVVLKREGWEAFYDENDIGHVRHIATNTVAEIVNPHRPLTPQELQRKDQLREFLTNCSEDELIEDVLLPLFRQLGFQRVTAAGHKDKALEYGKDVWMKLTLPTLHVLYFGIQVKKGKLDSAGMSKSGSRNVGEILNQVTMMLGHEIFDPETNRRVLVDHAYIICGGEITKQAKNWLGERLDAAKRSQIMFMDREDILNLFTVANLPLPKNAIPSSPDVITFENEIPF